MCAEAAEAFDLAWAHAESALRFQGVERGRATLYERIAARLILGIPTGRSVPEGKCAGVPGLWKLAISGDLPLVTLRVDRGFPCAWQKRFLNCTHTFLHAACGLTLRFSAFTQTNMQASCGSGCRI